MSTSRSLFTFLLAALIFVYVLVNICHVQTALTRLETKPQTLAGAYLDAEWVEYEKYNEREMIFTDLNATEVITSNQSYFDRAASLAYHEAASLTVEDRDNFNLSTWTLQTTGGLLDADRALLGVVYREANSVFEFGLGESTLIAAAVGVPRYTGVDTNPVWVADVRSKCKNHFRFYWADIGATRPWGYPRANLKKNSFNYQISSLSNEAQPFDVYLVDGRYRVACAAASFLHAVSRGANMTNVQVGVHDQHMRRGYHVALNPLTVTTSKSNALYFYKLRDTAKIEDVYELWRKYRYVTL